MTTGDGYGDRRRYKGFPCAPWFPYHPGTFAAGHTVPLSLYPLPSDALILSLSHPYTFLWRPIPLSRRKFTVPRTSGIGIVTPVARETIMIRVAVGLRALGIVRFLPVGVSVIAARAVVSLVVGSVAVRKFTFVFSWRRWHRAFPGLRPFVGIVHGGYFCCEA